MDYVINSLTHCPATRVNDRNCMVAPLSLPEHLRSYGCQHSPGTVTRRVLECIKHHLKGGEFVLEKQPQLESIVILDSSAKKATMWDEDEIFLGVAREGSPKFEHHHCFVEFGSVGISPILRVCAVKGEPGELFAGDDRATRVAKGACADATIAVDRRADVASHGPDEVPNLASVSFTTVDVYVQLKRASC